MSDTFANVSLPPGVHELTLTVPTRLPELTQILDWLALQISPCLSPEHFWQVQLIIVEGFTNTVKYAHSCLPASTPVRIALLPLPDYLEIQIWDFGPPFDLQGRLRYLLTHPDPYSEGKQGLILISKASDYLDYRRVNSRQNCLVARKAAPWSPVLPAGDKISR
ncbi:MAG: ATP-binding protein [Cyanobacteriota bacterium]|nr:ATP-binding protein [Cyanobacteriota bacterium]